MPPKVSTDSQHPPHTPISRNCTCLLRRATQNPRRIRAEACSSRGITRPPSPKSPCPTTAARAELLRQKLPWPGRSCDIIAAPRRLTPTGSAWLGAFIAAQTAQGLERPSRFLRTEDTIYADCFDANAAFSNRCWQHDATSRTPQPRLDHRRRAPCQRSAYRYATATWPTWTTSQQARPTARAPSCHPTACSRWTLHRPLDEIPRSPRSTAPGAYRRMPRDGSSVIAVRGPRLKVVMDHRHLHRHPRQGDGWRAGRLHHRQARGD